MADPTAPPGRLPDKVCAGSGRGEGASEGGGPLYPAADPPNSTCRPSEDTGDP